MKCRVCGKPLEKSQYSKDGKYKSCPRCSVLNGEEHVYFEYPAGFGRSTKRETAIHPDGPQSYCYTHRQDPNRNIPVDGILCGELNE